MKQMIKKLAIVLSVALVCAPMGATAASKLIVKDATGVIDKMVVTDSGFIGVGTTPSVSIHTKGISISQTQILSHLVGTGATNSGGYLAYRNNPSTVNSGLPQSGDRIGYILFGGLGTNGTSPLNSSGLLSAAEANWTDTNYPSYFAFETAPANTTYRLERMRIASNGNIGISTITSNERLEVNGGIRIYPVNQGVTKDTASPIANTRPTCAANKRGTIWFTPKAVGADTLEICAKNASDVYGWALVTIVSP